MRKPHQKVYIYGIGYLVKLARAKISGKNLCDFPRKLCGFIAFFRPCHRSLIKTVMTKHRKIRQFSSVPEGKL